MSPGKSVRLFLAEGTPGGLLTAEIMNWTGHVVAAPRSDLASLLKRPEVERTGVYILLGDDPESLGDQLAYIGESDDVKKRLTQHNRPTDQNGKEFWNRAIVLTSKDANLTKAHVRYLESRFIEIGHAAGRASLTNSTAPTGIALPEADRSDMEYFIEQAKIVLPVLNVNLFRSLATSIPRAEVDVAASSETTPIFEVRQNRANVHARAQEVDGEFTVLEGSTARLTWAVKQQGQGYSDLRVKLENDEVLVRTTDEDLMRFTRDHVFSSPSAASSVVLGRSSNGRTEWVLEGTRTTYGEWQQQGIEASAQDEE